MGLPLASKLPLPSGFFPHFPWSSPRDELAYLFGESLVSIRPYCQWMDGLLCLEKEKKISLLPSLSFSFFGLAPATRGGLPLIRQ